MSELQIVRFRGDVQSGCYIIFGMKYDLCWRLESEAVFIVVSAEISRDVPAVETRFSRNKSFDRRERATYRCFGRFF